MKIFDNKKYLEIALYSIFVGCSVIVFFLAVSNFSLVWGVISSLLSIASPIIYAAIFAFFINPLMKLYENKVVKKFLIKAKEPTKKQKGFTRVISILLSYITILLFVAIILNIVIPQLAESISALVSNFDSYMDEADILLANFFNFLSSSGLVSEATVSEFYIDIDAALENVMNLAVTYLPQIIDGVRVATIQIGNIVLGFLISIYILAGKENFRGQAKKLTVALLPVRAAKNTIRVLKLSNDMFLSFLLGKTLDSMIIGVLCAIGTAILRIPFAPLVSTIVALTNMIPYFGPIIGGAICTLFVVIVDPWAALRLGIFILGLQQLDGNVIGPKILGDSTGLSPFLVIVAILIGGGLWGFTGMFVAVPLFAILLTLLKEFIAAKLKQKNIDNIDKI